MVVSDQILTHGYQIKVYVYNDKKKRKLELSIFIKLFPPPTNMNRVLLINNRSKLSLIKSRLMHRRRAAKNTTTTELN